MSLFGRAIQILISTVISLFLVTEVKSQPAYQDSVKEFLSDFFIDSSGHVFYIIQTESVLDDAVFLDSKIDSFTYNYFDFNSSCKVYKWKYHIGADGGTVRTPSDSIIFSKNELAYMLSKMRFASVARWNQSYLKSKRILNSRTIDSLYEHYYYVRKKYNDLCKELDYDKKKIDKDPVANGCRHLLDSAFTKFAFLKISNPVFLRSGSLAVVYFHQFSPPLYINYTIAVYKRNKNHWKYFGDIFYGNVN